MNCNSNCFGGNCWWIIILMNYPLRDAILAYLNGGTSSSCGCGCGCGTDLSNNNCGCGGCGC